MEAAVNGEDRVIAAAQQIVRSLGTSKNVKEDMLLILSGFDDRLSAITDLLSGVGTGTRGCGRLESRLDAAERVISRWGGSSSSTARGFVYIPWESSPDEAAEYLSAVDEVISMTEEGGSGEEPEDVAEVLDRAEGVLQMAMDRLEDELRHVMIQNTVPFDAARLYGSMRSLSLSFTVSGGEAIEDYESSGEEDHEAYLEERSTGGSLSEDLLGVELVRPEAIPHLKSIAERMIRARYEKECCHVCSSIRRDVLEECLSILGIEKMSIEEVQRLGWKDLDDKMKKWIQAVKVVFGAMLLGEKQLCDQIYEVSPAIGEICFCETAKGCVMQLLNFAEAVAIGQRAPEKLFRLLDMYDSLANVLPNMETIFPEEAREFLCGEGELILKRLGDAAKGTLAEFENAVMRETSRKLVQFGDIHPLTRYVMNYLKLMVDYSGTLNGLIAETETEIGELPEKGDDHSQEAGSMSPLARHVLSTISCLECNIEEKSRLYEDSGLQYVFLMNNILYMVQKVKDSELGTMLGSNWVRKRRGQIRQHARNYLRASWIKVLSFLKDEGIGVGGSSSNISKVALKERFKNFNMAFEDLYRNQITWKVPDTQLREELRISISEKVIPAYRSFMGRFGGHLEGGRHAAKYMKYTADDLENYLLDLFEGMSGPSNHPRRKLSG